MAGPLTSESSQRIDLLKEACNRVLAKVGKLSKSARRKKLQRGAGGDISTTLDVTAEKLIIDFFEERGIAATIIAEERGTIRPIRTKTLPVQKVGGYLLVDAIDGTTNANLDIPFYCCSVAYADDFKLSSVKDAAVIDLVSGNLYWASKGLGAFVNRKRIHVNRKFQGLLGLNISSVEPEITMRLANVIARAKHVRQFGAIALEMCYLAEGKIDAFIDFRGKVRPTDLAAGYLIAKESGAEIYSPSGEKLDAKLGLEQRLSFFAGTKNAKRAFGPDIFR